MSRVIWQESETEVEEMQRDVNRRKTQQNELLKALEENLILKTRISTLEESLQFSRGERAELELKLRLLTNNSHHAEVRIAGLTQQCYELEAVLLASGRLLAALTREDAIRAIQDIVANVIGSEQMALFTMPAEKSEFEIIAYCGITKEQCLQAAGEDGMVARVWQSGTAIFPRSGGSGFTACVPLRAKQKLVAVLAIFSLLPQKLRLEPMDIEIMKFLEHYAGELLVAKSRRNGKEQI
ncbi:MAG TPA: GAF domain-containing protein [Candidatus Angelobacter sp.]